MQFRLRPIDFVLIASLALIGGYSFVRFNSLEKQITILNERVRLAAGSSTAPGGAMSSDSYQEKQVRNTIIKHQKSILACYQAFLKQAAAASKKKEGRIIMDWTIQPEGEVESAQVVQSEIGDDALHQCIVGTIKGWRFPKPPFGEPKYVEHTFQFRDEENSTKK